MHYTHTTIPGRPIINTFTPIGLSTFSVGGLKSQSRLPVGEGERGVRNACPFSQ